MSEWISVKDCPCPKHEWVLLCCISKENSILDPYILVGARGYLFDENRYECAYGDGYIPYDIEITHWMPLPKLPENV